MCFVYILNRQICGRDWLDIFSATCDSKLLWNLELGKTIDLDLASVKFFTDCEPYIENVSYLQFVCGEVFYFK